MLEMCEKPLREHHFRYYTLCYQDRITHRQMDKETYNLNSKTLDVPVGAFFPSYVTLNHIISCIIPPSEQSLTNLT